MRELLLIVGCIVFFYAPVLGQEQVYLIDFENVTNGVDYTTSSSECRKEGGAVYFGVVPDSLVSDTARGNYFAAQNIKNSPCSVSSAAATITITGIDISEVENNLELSVLLSRNRFDNQWEGNSYFHIDYQIDGGEYQSGLWIEADGSNGGSKGVPALDADNDGVGESTKVGSSFGEFSKIITGRGDSLDIRISYNRFVTKVDLDFDNLKLSDTEDTPEPLPKTLPYTMDFNFETNGSDYVTSIDECSAENVWFGVFKDSLNIDSANKYFAVQNMESAPCSSPTDQDTISISGIEISDATHFLQLAIDLGEATDETDEWDSDTFFHLDYQVDDNGFNNGIWVEANASGQAAIDSDFDGIGDDTQLLSRFDTFAKILGATGDTLDLRIIIGGMDELGEEIGFDNIKVEAASARAKTLPYTLDFDDEINGLDYITSMGECGDLSNEVVFGVFEETGSLISNNNGSFFEAHLITTAPCSSGDGSETITISGIDISDVTDFLKLSVDLAELQVDSLSWNSDTFMHIDYKVNDGSYENVIWVEADTSNFPAIDLDYDGVGDASRIDSLFSTFFRHAKVSGDSLELRITYKGMDSQGVDLAIDNLKVEEISTVAKSVPYSLDFETELNGLHYITSMGECTNDDDTFFGRINTSLLSGLSIKGFAFGAGKLKQAPCSSSDGIETLFVTSIDISSVTGNLNLFLEALHQITDEWEEDEFVHFDYQIDGNGYKNGIWFEADNEGKSARDYNFDGIADSSEITFDAKGFSQVLAGSGSSLDLRITTSISSEKHDMFFDNLKVEETSEETSEETAEQPVTEITEREAFYLMDFENVTNGIDYTTINTECTNGGQIFFGVYDSTEVNADGVNNFSGSFFGVSETVKSGCSIDEDTVYISGIDISSVNAFFKLKVDLARWINGGKQAQWLNYSSMHIDVRIDNGEYQHALWVEGSVADGKGIPQIDTDFDEIGDGTGIGESFNNFSSGFFSANGNTLDIRIAIDGFRDNVNLLIDNITLTEINAVAITGSEGWRLLSTATQSATYSELLEPIWTQGLSNGADVSNGLANVFTFSTDTDAFEALTDLTQTIMPGQGFAVYVYADDDFDGTEDTFPKYLPMDGALNTGDIFPSLNTEASGDGAFTLVGNPYASTIDWDLFTRNDLSEVVYVYDPSVLEYKTWNGISGGLTNGLINAYTGFWVENNTSENPILLMQEGDEVAAKAVASVSGFGIKAQMGGLESATYFSFNPEGTEGKDKYDAHKLTPLDFVPYVSLATRIGEGLYDINNLPTSFDNELTIPLSVAAYTTAQTGWVEQTGEITLSWPEIQTLPEGWSVMLKDLETGTTINLRTQTSYTFDFEAAKAKVKAVKSANVLSPLGVVKEQSVSSDRFTLTLRNSGTVATEPVEHPTTFKLEQNYPNPFNPSTVISYQLAESGKVTLTVYDLMGRKVAVLVDQQKKAGSYNVTWNAGNLASGIYIYRLQAGASTFTKKMTLIK